MRNLRMPSVCNLRTNGWKECFDDTTPTLDSFDTIGGQLLASIFARGGFHVLTIELIVNLQPHIDSASSIEIPSLTPRLQTNHTDFKFVWVFFDLELVLRTL